LHDSQSVVNLKVHTNENGAEMNDLNIPGIWRKLEAE